MCDVPVTGTDFLPTIMSMTGGGTPPSLDGLDLTGVLRGGKALDRDALYWHYPHYSDQGGTPSGAIREGDWKLVEFFEDNHLELYNLSVDPGEGYNFASSYTDKAYELRAKLAAWREKTNASMPTSNPAYNQELAEWSMGPKGCSWMPSRNCLED